MRKPDFLALGFDLARNDGVKQERRDHEEDRWNDAGHRTKLTELAFEKRMRRLLIAPVGSGCAIGAEDLVDGRDHVVDRGAAQQTQCRAIERAFVVQVAANALRPIQKTP